MVIDEGSQDDGRRAGRTTEVVDLSPAGATVPPTASRSRAVLVALAVVAALAAAVLVLVPSDDQADDEVAVEEEDGTTTTTEAREDEGRDVPDAESFPAPLALGAPDDGKESVGLPVKAEPSTGLVDGQTVVVTGSGFPPGESVGVVMCTKEAGREHGARGVDACNIGRFAQGNADADGVATISFQVRRLVALDGQEVDCASEAQRCLIGMGLISDYDQSGGVLVDFDASQPLPDPPTVELAPDGPFSDGQAVTVRVEGLFPDTGVGAMVCTEDGTACAESGVSAMAGSDGAATFEVHLWRIFSAPPWEPGMAGRDVDCAVVACHLQTWGEGAGGRAVPHVPLTFTAGDIDRQRPVLEVRSTGPYSPGDQIEAFVPGAGRTGGVDLMLCGPQACAGGMVEAEWLLGGTLVRLTVPSEHEGNPCIGQPCRLVGHVYAPPDAGEPPALAPEPVEIVVEA